MNHPIQRRTLIGSAAAASLFGSLPMQVFGQAGKTLTVGMPFAPQSMDPAISGNGRAGVHLYPCYEPLVRERADGSFEPALATAWKLSADLKEVTFTLRKDAKFADGDPVNAAAVKKSFEYWRGKKGPFTVNFLNVTAVEAPDAQTFIVKMSEPQPSLVGLFSAYWNAGDIISPKGVDSGDKLGATSAGAGPYKLDPAATVTRKSYVYTRNEHYYDKKRQYWDKVIITVFEDQNSAVQSLKAGQTQVLVSDPLTGHANAETLPKGFHMVSDPVQWTGLIIMDRDGALNPALKDVRVRRAINMALNRPLIGRALFGKFIEPSCQMQGKGFMGYDPANEDKYPYSLEKSKALLAEAGHPNLTITIAYVNNSLSVTLTQAIASQLRRAGITVKTFEYQNFNVMNAAFAKKETEILLFNSNFGPPNLARFQALAPKGSLNPHASEDAELTRLMNEAAKLPLDKAEAAWKKVYARVVDLAWFAPVGATHTVFFAADSIKMPRMGSTLVTDIINMEPAKKG